MISFKKAFLYVLVITICLRSSSVLRIIGINRNLVKNWDTIYDYFALIIFPTGILLLLKGNFKEFKKL
ncbi:MAG: hypothetical protein ACWIPI_04035, partial [Polaribacter sp.]